MENFNRIPCTFVLFVKNLMDPKQSRGQLHSITRCRICVDGCGKGIRRYRGQKLDTHPKGNIMEYEE